MIRSCETTHQYRVHQQRAKLFGTLLMAIMLMPFSAMAAYVGGPVTNGGSISGAVTLKGTPPTLTPIIVNKDKQVCGKTPIYSQDLVVGKDRGINNVVVRLTDITKGKPQTPASVTLTQQGCGFRPHVVTVQTGGEVVVANGDPVTHNIHTFSFDNPQLNQAQPAGSPTLTIKPTIAETIKVQCDIHKWMAGWVVVAEHPYYAVSDAAGHFTLTDVPAGSYTLEFWQESLGVVTQKVTVKAGQTVQVSAQMSQQ